MLKHVVVWKVKNPSLRAAHTAALERNQKHPLHLDVKAILAPLVTGRRCVDWDA